MTITMSSAHSPIFPSLHLRHNSFSNPSVVLSTSHLIPNPSISSPMFQFILQPFFRFSYVTTLILQPFRHFTYVTTHSPTLLSLYLDHSSILQPFRCFTYVKFILQPFFRFSYVTSSSLNSPGVPPMSSLNSFTSDKVLNAFAIRKKLLPLLFTP